MEGNRLFNVCLLTICLISTDTQASVIKFAAYPSELKTNLTSSASMRCSLTDTDANGAHIGKRSVTTTTDDILHISAIVISRNNGQDVASVTPYDAPMAEVDLGNLQVKGDVSGTSSEAYLELTWMDPSSMAMGEYVCEITTVNIHHHSVLFTTTLEMTEVTPTINDVITELKKQTTEQQKQDQEINDLKQQQTIETNKLTTEIEDLKQQQTIMKQCASHRVGFMAVISNSKTVTSSQPVVFDKVIYSVGGGYNNVTGQFICSEPGIYSFSIHSLSAHSAQVGLNLKLNSNTITSLYSYGPGSTVETGAASALLHLQRNDIVHVMVDTGRNSVFYTDSNIPQSNVFVGHMVQSDCVV